jgi:hypothetical protein
MGDKYYLWEESTNPTSILGTKEWESDDLDELYKIASNLVHQYDGCGDYYVVFIEDRYLEETVDVVENIR